MRLSSPAESKRVLQEMVSHFVVGSACFFVLAVAALATDYAGLFTLVLSMPGYATIALLGAATTFAPIVFAAAIGGVRRGEQTGSLLDLNND